METLLWKIEVILQGLRCWYYEETWESFSEIISVKLEKTTQ